MCRVYRNVHFAAIAMLALLAVGYESTAGVDARSGWVPAGSDAFTTLVP